MTELYTTTKPAATGRAAVASTILFLTTLGLAAGMSQSRRTRTLGPIFPSPELGLIIPTPRGFAPSDAVDTRLGRALPFYGRTVNGNEAELVIRRVPREANEDAASVCRRVLSDMVPFWVRPFGRVTIPASEEQVGAWPAVQVSDRRMNVLLRVATPPGAPAVVVSFTVKGEPIDESHYRMFERVCQGIRPLSASGK